MPELVLYGIRLLAPATPVSTVLDMKVDLPDLITFHMTCGDCFTNMKYHCLVLALSQWSVCNVLMLC